MNMRLINNNDIVNYLQNIQASLQTNLKVMEEIKAHLLNKSEQDVQKESVEFFNNRFEEIKKAFEALIIINK